jgi:hypothetical protein
MAPRQRRSNHGTATCCSESCDSFDPALESSVDERNTREQRPAGGVAGCYTSSALPPNESPPGLTRSPPSMNGTLSVELPSMIDECPSEDEVSPFTLFGNFVGNMEWSDFPRPCIAGLGCRVAGG